VLQKNGVLTTEEA
jgi:hypothetical protein